MNLVTVRNKRPVTAVPVEAAQEPHLHLEARRDGACLDPRGIIEGKG